MANNNEINELPKFNWKLTANEIKEKAKKLIEHSTNVQNSVALLSEPRTFQNTILPLAELDRYMDTHSNEITFPSHVSTEKEVRDAGTEADKELSRHAVESSMRHDIFQAISAYAQLHNLNELDAESKRLVERLLRDFKRNGLHLPSEERTKLEALQKEISELGILFQKNLGEENRELLFSKEELEGVPESLFGDLKQRDNKYILTLKYPHYFPVMKNCRVENTRQQMETAFNSRCLKENTEILEKIVALRDTRAKMLGYKTHADYILEVRMAKNQKTVLDFLNDLSARLDPLSSKELQEFLQLKKEEKESRGEHFDGKLHWWDYGYYMRMREEKLYQVNQEELKKYFPLQVVTKGLLEIYQTLLGLTFKEIESPHTWHPEVKMYSVRDTAEGYLLGHFYLDLFPREGKYGHAACFGLQPGCELDPSTHTRQYPAAAMVANFSRQNLDHDEVETFFHEFGHVVHQICSITKYSMFSGTAVERDFVEAPSQMLENWVWQKESLAKMSSHVDDGSPIPEQLLNNLISSKVANAGIFNKRQIMLGMFDQRIHSQPQSDTSKIFGELHDEIVKIPKTPGTNMGASFGHVAGGYDAQYYGYLWSEVFSADMFASTFKIEGILNPSVGMKYRKCILQTGGSKDASEMLKDFLGREPNNLAFLKSKGL